ncbi:MAG: helix-turn-helix domain-containing protein [Bdellovibrionota bacterium]
MKQLTEEELKRAFYFWHQTYESVQEDKELAPFLNEEIQPRQGWLKKARNGLFLSTQTVASNLKISRAAYARYEKGEETGAITIATLAKAAEAMDCELVYAIRPKNKKPFAQAVWKKLLAAARSHPWLQTCDQKKRATALATIAKNYMTDAKFRRKQSWSQRANK